MINLKELLELPIIELDEANSGYSDHKLHKDIAKEIYNGWIELLKNINKLENTNKYYHFNIGIKMEEILSELKIQVYLWVMESNGNEPIDSSNTSINENPVKIYLLLRPNFSVNDVLNNKDELEELAHHEAVHLIKILQKIHQLGFKKGDLDSYNSKLWYKYHINSNEIHAYISQINNELKHIKLKNKDISFSDAIKLSKVWRRYTKSVFNKSPKLRNKMLSKIVNYWNNL